MRSWARRKHTITVHVSKRLENGTDAQGNPVTAFSAPVTVKNVVYAPGATDETMTALRDHSVAAATLYCPPGTDIGVHDRVTTPDGRVWNVNGEPKVWPANPYTGKPAGIVVELAREEG